MSKNSDKPAFAKPSTGHLDSFVAGSDGLTKREYFAGVALQGLLAKEGFVDRMAMEEIKDKSAVQMVCKASLKIADELLKQLDTK